MFIVSHNISVEFQKFLIKLSPRYYLQDSYLSMVFDNWWGMGWGNGIKYVQEYMPAKYILNNIATKESNEQHSLYIQILNEGGFVAYFLFIVFILKLLLRGLRTPSVKYMAAFVVLLFNFIFLNGLNEFIFYWWLAIILKIES